MASPLASPRSSTSSSDIYISEPPLTPMSEIGLDKATEKLVLTDADTEDEGLDTIPESTGASTGGISSGADAEPKRNVQASAIPAYRTRPDARTEAQDQFAGFSFGRPPPLAPPITSTSDLPTTERFPPRSAAQAIPQSSLTTPPRSPGGAQLHPSPSASFSFGSCPSVPLSSTPTAELGAFEYPEFEVGHPLHTGTAPESVRMGGSSSSSSTSSASSSFSRGSTSSGHRGSIPLGLALGQTHRRNSIIARPPLHPTSSSSSSTHTLGPTGYPSPPQTRRSSTTSTIMTLPAAGRRPSIIHSATTELGSTGPLPSISSIYPGPPDSHIPPSPYNNNNRRASILFPQKHLHQPVPPSLLARRGSMPVSSLAGTAAGPGSTPLRSGNTRSSISIPLAGYGGPGQITSHRLYNRRESVLSVGSSQGSGSTVRMGRGEGESGEVTRRSSLRETRRTPTKSPAQEEEENTGQTGERATQATAGLGRRSSMPIHHALSATTRQDENDRAALAGRSQADSLHPYPPHSPASPRSTLPSSRGLPGAYGSPIRRSRGSLTGHLPIPESGDTDAVPDPAYRMGSSGRGWTPRPSLSGRTLSSSEESDESGEGVGDSASDERHEGVGQAEAQTMQFSDPWGSASSQALEGGSAEQHEEGIKRQRQSLVDLGRPGLETVKSDRTEKAE